MFVIFGDAPDWVAVTQSYLTYLCQNFILTRKITGNFANLGMKTDFSARM